MRARWSESLRLVALGLALIAATSAETRGQSRPSEQARAGELPSAAPKEVGFFAEKLEQVNALVQAAIDKQATAGVVIAVARRGKVVKLESFGKMDVEADKAMRDDAIFRIYSMSKPITTVAALMLVEEKKLKLDEPVSAYLPELKGLRVYGGKPDETVEAKREVTVRDLMRHTSGFVYGMADTPVDRLYNDANLYAGTLADMVRKLAKLPLLDQPGTRFNYSVSTDVLGRVIEVVSKRPLDEFFQERIFGPLDMHDTGFFVPQEKLDRFTASYRPAEGKLKVADAPASSHYRAKPKLLSGGGGLVSTARDYLRFSQMLLNGGELDGARLLTRETVHEMSTNQLPPEALPMSLGGFPLPGHGFGLGMLVSMDDHGPGSGEYGWSGAASTFFWIAPKSELIGIIMQQVEPISVGLKQVVGPAVYGALAD